jgi:hypothetical protein
MKKTVKYIVGAVVVIVLIVAGVFAGSQITRMSVTEERNEGSALVAAEAIKSFKISSLTYRYTNFIYSDAVNKIGDFEIPFTQKYLGVRYDGVMEIGIDASLIEVTQTNTTITLKLPPTEILSHTLVNDSEEVLVDVGTVFNDNSVSDYTELFNNERKAMEEKIITGGLLVESRDNAEEQLRNFLEALPGVAGTYTIVFE